jgi:hypothetical protein
MTSAEAARTTPVRQRSTHGKLSGGWQASAGVSVVHSGSGGMRLSLLSPGARPSPTAFVPFEAPGSLDAAGSKISQQSVHFVLVLLQGTRHGEHGGMRSPRPQAPAVPRTELPRTKTGRRAGVICSAPGGSS